MTISWFGISSFKIVGKDVTLITDPFGSEVGLTPVRGAADVIICSNSKNFWCNNFSSISSNPLIIQSPGEYDVKGCFIIGTRAENQELGESIIYYIELEDIRIAFIGPINQNQLTEVQREVLEGADIVLISTGNKGALNSEQATKIATVLEPFIVIPHSYKIPNLSVNFDKLDKFIQEMGGKFEAEDKLTVKKKDLTGESTKLIVLKPQR